MFKVICNKCNKDCDKIATFVEIKRVTNYATCITDIGSPMGNIDATMQLALCQDCYSELGFPNIYDKSDNKRKFIED